MPHISEDELASRRTEIIDACETLYQTESYRDISMARIAEHLSFSRANIYNYFQTKEEIFLALFQREHELWAVDLDRLRDAHESLSRDELADGIAATIESRGQLLKLMAMNCYDMEENSRFECLVEFKRSYRRSIEALDAVCAQFIPEWDAAQRERFIGLLLPFMFGIFPYTKPTEKQRHAMGEAGITPPVNSAFDLSRAFILMALV